MEMKAFYFHSSAFAFYDSCGIRLLVSDWIECTEKVYLHYWSNNYLE